MRALVPSETALVLGGGGAKGAYEVGAIAALDEKLRLPVVLYYLEGFKIREIAAMLGVPDGTVKTRLRNAREQLRKDLKGACFA